MEDLATLRLPQEQSAADQTEVLDVAETLRGAGYVTTEVEPGFPLKVDGDGEGLVLEEPAKPKRGRPRKVDQQAAAQMEAFFSPDGIGKVWVTGLNAFYKVCEAPLLDEQEDAMHRSVFSAWCKARMPSSANQYQPDLLLAATVLMSTLPRLNPIANATVPFWRRMFAKLRGKKVE